MTPGALPAANLRLPASSQAPCRTTARTPHARVPPSTNPLEHAQHHARNCPCPALQTTAHCAQQHQHLHSIISTRIALALTCARARLPACVHPPRPADQPHPLPRDALPCLSSCALCARHTTMCSRCASTFASRRPQLYMPDQPRSTSRQPHLHAHRLGAGFPVPRHPGCQRTYHWMAAEHSRALLML